jgi:hypothetical protein
LRGKNEGFVLIGLNNRSNDEALFLGLNLWKENELVVEKRFD